jgi:branched-chain amino acid transport system substrate-binding protein
MRRVLAAFAAVVLTLWAAVAAAGEYRIGVLVPLSGPKADKGVPIKNAVELFVEHLNAAGGIRGDKVRLVVRDDRDDPE